MGPLVIGLVGVGSLMASAAAGLVRRRSLSQVPVPPSAPVSTLPPVSISIPLSPEDVIELGVKLVTKLFATLDKQKERLIITRSSVNAWAVGGVEIAKQLPPEAFKAYTDKELFTKIVEVIGDPTEIAGRVSLIQAYRTISTLADVANHLWKISRSSLFGMRVQRIATALAEARRLALTKTEV